MSDQTPPRQSDIAFRDRAYTMIAETNALIDTCHERRACPTCGAPVGERCHSLARCSTAKPHTVKHPHRERWGVPVR